MQENAALECLIPAPLSVSDTFQELVVARFLGRRIYRTLSDDLGFTVHSVLLAAQADKPAGKAAARTPPMVIEKRIGHYRPTGNPSDAVLIFEIHQ